MTQGETRTSTILGIDPGTNLMGYSLLHHSGKNLDILSIGVLDLRKCKDAYARLGRIYEYVSELIFTFSPKELAIEAPFFGKNVQSMLKLGRAQGVVIAAATNKGLPIFEYAPLKIKMSITGNGLASKEQVAAILKKVLYMDDLADLPYMDATDALAVAYCHYLSKNAPTPLSHTSHASGWKDFLQRNKDRVISPNSSSSSITTSLPIAAAEKE